jgi:hypothetical protein
VELGRKREVFGNLAQRGATLRSGARRLARGVSQRRAGDVDAAELRRGVRDP